MNDWNTLLSRAESVDAVMAVMGEFLGHMRSERHHFLLPPQCRTIILSTPSDVYWWASELGKLPPGAGTPRMILQGTRSTFAAACQRLNELGYRSAGRRPESA